MTRTWPTLAFLLAACSSTTIVYVPYEPDAAPADTSTAPDTSTPDAAVADTYAPPPDTYAPPVDTGPTDTGWHVRCAVDAGAGASPRVYEACNGIYGWRIDWYGSDGQHGICWPASEDAGSPAANCVPDPPCEAGATCPMGYCLVQFGYASLRGTCK